MLLTKPTAKKHTPPAKAWRNKYKAIRNLRVIPTRERVSVGHAFWGESIWPSKEIAEEKAAERVKAAIAKFGSSPAEHLGAFPA